MGLNLYNEQVYVIKEARELLFEGYQDDMIDMARHLANSPFGSFKIPYDRFGWFYSVCQSPFNFLKSFAPST